MSVENDCNIRLTCMLPCACYCLLDACNMHVTCALFRIGKLPYFRQLKICGLLFETIMIRKYLYNGMFLRAIDSDCVGIERNVWSL